MPTCGKAYTTAEPSRVESNPTDVAESRRVESNPTDVVESSRVETHGCCRVESSFRMSHFRQSDVPAAILSQEINAEHRILLFTTMSVVVNIDTETT
jgi:hypothetical protein